MPELSSQIPEEDANKMHALAETSRPSPASVAALRKTSSVTTKSDKGLRELEPSGSARLTASASRYPKPSRPAPRSFDEIREDILAANADFKTVRGGPGAAQSRSTLNALLLELAEYVNSQETNQASILYESYIMVYESILGVRSSRPNS